VYLRPAAKNVSSVANVAWANWMGDLVRCPCEGGGSSLDGSAFLCTRSAAKVGHVSKIQV
jgi:hypothetical protein